MKNPENMTAAELTKLRDRVEQLLAGKAKQAKVELRAQMMALAKKQGLSLDDVLNGSRGKSGKKAKGKVAIKYRDPNNPANTWTGRGRTPRWMVAAMKGSKVKKEHFLI
jgi:DNA-binding protein H-NS